MARVFKKTYTRAIPEGAERVTAKSKKGADVPAVRFKGEDGKWVVAPLTRSGDRCRVQSPTWYGWMNGAAVPLCGNRDASEVMLADLVRQAARGEAGMVDPFEDNRKRSLTKHLDDFRVMLQSKGGDPRHVRQTIAHIEAMLDG